MIVLLLYIAMFISAFLIVKLLTSRIISSKDYTSLKTVTFGDESTVIPNRWASFLSILSIFSPSFFKE